MAISKNRYGLTRTIPPEVKRLVRQRCGFGCVICGLALCDYEHVNPEFHNAKFHDPEAIVLLCPNHHASVTRGVISKRKVMEAAKNPAAFKRGFTSGFFEVSDGPLTVNFGGMICEDTPKIITIGEIPLLSFAKSDFDDEPWQMSAIMADYHGNPLLSVQENQWRASTTKWDIQVQGNRLVIRNGACDIGLKLRHDPGNSIVFERAKVSFAGIKVECSEHGPATFTQPDGNILTMQGTRVISCGGAIQFGIPPEIERSVELWTRRAGEFHHVASREERFRNIPFHY